MLQRMVEADAMEREWQAYVADTIGALAIRIFRWTGYEQFEMPLFSELHKKKVKQLTAEEIKENVIRKLSK